MNGFYLSMLRSAWDMTWRHKGLWLFGIFAALIAEEVEAIIRNYYIVANQSLALDRYREFFGADTFGGLINLYKELIISSPASSIFGIVAVIVIVVVMIWLIIVSQTAIFRNASALMKKKPYRWSEGFGAGIAYFWPVLILNLILKIVDYALLIVVGLALSAIISTSAYGFGVLLIVVTFIVSMIISILGKYALGYVVLNNERVTVAIKKGFRLFTANWLLSIETAFLLFAITTVIGLALLTVCLIIAVPFLLLIWLFAIAGIAAGTQVLFVTGLLVLFLIIITVGGALAAFRYCGWTIVFTRLLEGKAKSKLLHWADLVSKKIDARRPVA